MKVKNLCSISRRWYVLHKARGRGPPARAIGSRNFNLLGLVVIRVVYAVPDPCRYNFCTESKSTKIASDLRKRGKGGGIGGRKGGRAGRGGRNVVGDRDMCRSHLHLYHFL